MKEPPSLTGVYAKLDRAEEHLARLEGEICLFFNREPPPISLSSPQFDSESGWHVVKAVVKEPPNLSMGVTLGDFIHNVRSALDNLIWQLVLLDGGSPKRSNAFPVCGNPGEWDGMVDDKLRGITTPSYIEIIDRVQPYHAGNASQNTLAILNRISNADKHRVINPALAVIDDPRGLTDFRIVSGPGKIVERQFFGGAICDDNAEILRCRIDGFTTETKVEVHGDIPAQIAFGDSPIRWEGICQFLQFAQLMAQEFEPAFSK